MRNVSVSTKFTLKINQDNDVYVFFFFYFSGLNFQDLMVRQGAIDSPPKTPFILGFECSGDVEQVGENVQNYKVLHSRLLYFVYFVVFIVSWNFYTSTSYVFFFLLTNNLCRVE